MSLESQYKQYNTQFPAQEIVDFLLWDTVQFTSAAINNLLFFNATRATPDLGNMEIPSQLPYPKAFLIRAIGFKVKNTPRSTARAASGAVTTGAMSDLALLLNTGSLRLTIGAKPYAEFPLWMLPEGSGAFGFQGLDGNTADPGNVVDYAVNGWPDVRNQFTLAKPLFIAPQINFVVNVFWPAAITLVGGNTNVTVILSGDLIRPVQ